MSNGTETNWDAGATTWDRDYAGPDTRTIWDPIPEVVGRGLRVIWRAAGRIIQWRSSTRTIKWR